MTNEDKELLLKDLCGRLPYGPKVHVVGDWFYDYMEPYDSTLDKVFFNLLTPRNANLVVKAYLRPMSSMTMSEELEFTELCLKYAGKPEIENMVIELSEFYNKKHLDYRGLIEKGLAIEVTEENNPYK